MELWKPVVGFEGFYEVSNFGSVRSLDRYVLRKDARPKTKPRLIKGSNMKISYNTDGYCHLNLHKDGKVKLALVARLVAEAFIGSIDGMQVDHINNNRADNRVENLRICKKSENVLNKPLSVKNTSGYKGVSKYRNKWLAQIRFGGVTKYLGLYETPELAHEAYKQAAIKIHGEFCNFG